MSEETLQAIANQMVAPMKGILAADESSLTIKKRFDSIGIESTEDNRRAYREMLFYTLNLEKYISGVIMFDETLRQKDSNGVLFTELLKSKGIIPGIKVDLGTENFPNSEVEKFTNGLDGLSDRLKEYYSLGARFAKWRAVYIISDSLPSNECMEKNASDLAEYAYLCQQNGLVPIVEPEVLMIGTHNIERCFDVTSQVLKIVFQKLTERKVDLEGMILKPNMITSGMDYGMTDNPQTVAEMTDKCFLDSVPHGVPGIAFLSGGQTEQQACANLNAMNMTSEIHPWELSFSFGRALQNSALQTWAGKQENVIQAQEVFINRAKLVSLARMGEYKVGMES